MNWINIIIIVIILSLIILIFYTVKNSDKKRRTQYNELYNGSSGNYDASAENALKLIQEIKDKQPEDNFRAGNLLEFNLLQEDFINTPPAPVVDMMNQYAETVRGIGESINHTNSIDEIPGRIDPIYMLDHITEVRNNMPDRLINTEVGIEFNNAVATAPVIRKEKIREKKKEAVKESRNKRDEAKYYLEKSKSHTTDPQNVHDSSVNTDLRKTIEELKKTYPNNGSYESSIKEIKSYMNTLHLEPDKRQKADKALLLASNNNWIFTLNSSEGNILSMVWERAKHPQNEENANAIRTAVVDALADCIDKKGTNVCINGRCGRYLESLTTLDFSDDTGKAQTSEMYKNEIFSMTKQIIDDELKNAEKSSDPNMKLLVDAYNGKDVEVPAQTDKKFKENVYDRIDRVIQGYSEKLSAIQLENIRAQCKEAIN